MSSTRERESVATSVLLLRLKGIGVVKSVTVTEKQTAFEHLLTKTSLVQEFCQRRDIRLTDPKEKLQEYIL